MSGTPQRLFQSRQHGVPHLDGSDRVALRLNARATFFSDRTGHPGAEHELGVAAGNEEGDWPIPQIEIRRDWLVVLERE